MKMKKSKIKNMKPGYIYTPIGSTGRGNVLYCYEKGKASWIVMGSAKMRAGEAACEPLKSDMYPEETYYEVGNLAYVLNNMLNPDRELIT